MEGKLLSIGKAAQKGGRIATECAVLSNGGAAESNRGKQDRSAAI